MGKIEVEVKAKANLDRARRALSTLGANLVKIEVQEDIYFNHPCRDLLKLDEALRLRLQEEGAELTYKGPRQSGNEKARIEVTVKVSDAVEMLSLLANLGFKEALKVRKLRETYMLNDIEVALDKVEGLGEFVEIEVGEHDLSKAFNILEKLGAGEIVKETYAELLLKGERLDSGGGCSPTA
ncbi:MAG: class IV adenylate cyclase [Thermofilaceae archaeon]